MSRPRFAFIGNVLSLMILGVAVPAAAEQTPVDSSELARCAAISSGNERLACYDALAVIAVPGIRIAPAAVTAPAAQANASGAAAAGQTAPAAGSQSAATAGQAAPAALGQTGATATAAAGQTAATASQVASAAAGQGALPGASQTGAASGQAAAVAANQAALAAAGKAANSAARTANPDDPANFGLTRQQLKMVPAGPDSIKATVSQMTQDRLSHVLLVLDNGQTWVFTEPDPRVRPGDAVTIKRAALGSFLMKTPSRRSYRVERLN